MNKEIISERQGINISILLMFGSAMVMGTGGAAQNDIWLAILLAILFAIPAVLVYGRILFRYPGRDLYDILQDVFGKIFGKLLSILYIWFSFHLGALVLRNFGEFMNTVGLPETPKIVPIIIYGLICAMAVKGGIEVISKCGSYFIIITVALLLILAFLTIPNMKPENLLPIMYNGVVPVLRGAFGAFSFPFGELFLLMSVFDSLSTPRSSYRVYLKSLVIGGLILAFIGMRNVLVIGNDLGDVYFPSYSAISRVNIGNFLQRLEISVIIVFILSGFIKISVCLISATKGLTKLFGFKNYRFLTIPVALLMINLAYNLYDSTMEMFEWAQDIWPYYSFPFQVILPFFILIAVEIKARMKTKKENNKEEAPI